MLKDKKFGLSNFHGSVVMKKFSPLPSNGFQTFTGLNPKMKGKSQKFSNGTLNFGNKKKSMTDLFLDVGIKDKIVKPRFDYKRNQLVSRSMVGSPE